jgi:hypothetical protein
MSITIRGNTKINSRTTVGNYGSTPIPPSQTPTPTITPTPTTTPSGAYSFSVSPDNQACSSGEEIIVYSSSAVLGIGSTLYQDSGLTIPTTYSAISNPNDPGQDYFVITGNTITSKPLCD